MRVASDLPRCALRHHLAELSSSEAKGERVILAAALLANLGYFDPAGAQMDTRSLEAFLDDLRQMPSAGLLAKAGRICQACPRGQDCWAGRALRATGPWTDGKGLRVRTYKG